MPNAFKTQTKTGHEIAPNTVANATKITVLATKIQKLVAKLATRTFFFFTFIILFTIPTLILHLHLHLQCTC